MEKIRGLRDDRGYSGSNERLARGWEGKKKGQTKCSNEYQVSHNRTKEEKVCRTAIKVIL